MAQRVVDLSLLIEDNMPAHKLFQRPVITTHLSHESSKAFNLGEPAAERKLYRRLALTWLEIVIRIEPRAIEPRDADAAAFTLRTYARAGDQSRKNPLNRPGASAV
jgi:hypothetical protein